jgi:hypothetical protein
LTGIVAVISVMLKRSVSKFENKQEA